MEYFVDLKPKDQWRPLFHQDKDKLIEALGKQAEQFPGVTWNFSQPISDNMEEAVSGVKGELAVKIYGTDLPLLEQKGDEIVAFSLGQVTLKKALARQALEAALGALLHR